MERLLIIDVQMPILDGYSATHAIRTQAPFKDVPDIRHVPIVAITASAIEGDKEKCQHAGMDVSGPLVDCSEILKFVGLFSEASQRKVVGENAGQMGDRGKTKVGQEGRFQERRRSATHTGPIRIEPWHNCPKPQ